MDKETKQAEAHPIQNLLDEVARMELQMNGDCQQGDIIPLGPDVVSHLQDMLMSAYAKGKVS